MRLSVEELDRVLAVDFRPLAHALGVDLDQAKSYHAFCARERERQLVMEEVQRGLKAAGKLG
jgi:hypothetical protein